MDRGEGAVDPFVGLKEATEEYKVYDSHYEKIGKVDDLITDRDDQVLYVGVKMGVFGTNSTIVPVEILRINDRRRLIEVSEPAETIRHAPHFGRSEELTPELETHVRTYFGLGGLESLPEHEPRTSDFPAVTGDDRLVDTIPGERAEAQDRSVPAPERVPQEEDRPVEDQSRAGQEPISEPISEEPKSLWERLTSGGGVTVHRLRR